VAHDYSLATERLLLRPYAESDFDALLAIESRADVARWLYWEPRDAEAVREKLARKLAEASLEADGDGISFAAVLATSGEMIGACSMHLVSAEHRQGEIGYTFHPDHHGRGYATEAARALLGFGFEECGLHRIIGRLEPRNEASARVLERLGMRREAHLVENEWVKGEWQSEAVYAVLDREWRAASG
jgi:RimJ/RimL family protein N-acetyltransferase